MQDKEKANITPSRRKKGAAAVSLLLIAVLLFTGTWAWQNNLLHKSTYGKKDSQAVLKSVQLVDESANIDDWQVGDEVTKKIFVKNDGLDGSGGAQGGQDDRYEDVYVRITLREYMERINAKQEVYKDRLMIDSNGNFIELDNNAVGASGSPNRGDEINPIAAGQYKGRKAVYLHDDLKYKNQPGHNGWYIVTKAGDANGQYGNFMTTDVKETPQYLETATGTTAGNWVDGAKKANVPSQPSNSQTPGGFDTDGATEECNYPVINWKGARKGYKDYTNYTDDGTKAFRELVELSFEGNDKVRFLSDYDTGSGSSLAGKPILAGDYWLIDDKNDMCAYWMQALKPGAGKSSPATGSITSNFTTDMKLIASPNGQDPQGAAYPLNFYYTLHADLDPTLKADYKTDWSGMNSDVEAALFPPPITGASFSVSSAGAARKLSTSSSFKISVNEASTERTITLTGVVSASGLPDVTVWTPGGNNVSWGNAGSAAEGQTFDVVVPANANGTMTVQATAKGNLAMTLTATIEILPNPDNFRVLFYASADEDVLVSGTVRPRWVRSGGSMFQSTDCGVTTWTEVSASGNNVATSTGTIDFKSSGRTALTQYYLASDTTQSELVEWRITPDSGGVAKVSGNINRLLEDSDPNNVVLDGSAFAAMFRRCRNLISAKDLKLPSMTFTANTQQYAAMFNACYDLVEAPAILPATTIKQSMYAAMFANCTKLLESPAICATTLGTNQQMAQMFYGCSSLKKITIGITAWGNDSATNYWVYGVPSGGVFVCSPALADTSVNTNNYTRVPDGWTVDKTYGTP